MPPVQFWTAFLELKSCHSILFQMEMIRSMTPLWNIINKDNTLKFKYKLPSNWRKEIYFLFKCIWIEEGLYKEGEISQFAFINEKQEKIVREWWCGFVFISFLTDHKFSERSSSIVLPKVITFDFLLMTEVLCYLLMDATIPAKQEWFRDRPCVRLIN